MVDHDLAFAVLKSQNDLVIAARVAHWNVRGPNFFETHLLFERVYNEAGDKTDTLVETLRPLGYIPTFAEFAGPGGGLSTYAAPELVDMLMGYASAYYAALVRLNDSIEGDPMCLGLLNLLQDLCIDATGIMYLLSAAQGY